jgi:hypothetical protein
MKITVVSREGVFIGREIVRFSSCVGTGIAIWANEKAPPEVNRCYYSELDFEQPIQLGTNAEIMDRGVFSIADFQGNNLISGVMEGIDNEGMGYFRLSSDCLVITEIEGGNIGVGTPLTLKFRPCDISLFAG